ncbi:hypothetical protein V8D89_006569 [Ganoderma adspersum]
MLAYSQSVASTSTTRAADPFNSRDADVVLLSSDGVEFRVHKKLIRLGSRVLSELIPLAQPPPPSSSSPSRHHRKQRPVLHLADSSDVLDLFLRFLYPIPEPPTTLNDVYPLLELATKYGAPSVAARMRPHLLRPDHLAADPYVIYALAVYAGMPDIAAVAARHTLPHPIPSTLKLTEMAEGSALVRLLAYRRRCEAAAKSVVAAVADDDRVPWWIQMQWRRLCFLGQCWECAKLLPARHLKWDKLACGSLLVPEYWVRYMAGVREALGERLDAGVARDARLMRPALESAVRCSTCAGRAWWDLEEFAGILADAIEEAIYSVKLSSAVDEDEYMHADASAMMKVPKTNYLWASDRVVWPLFDYYFNVWSKRKVVEEDSECLITEVNHRTGLDHDTFYLARHISRASSVQPVDSMGNPLLPLMTIFPVPGHHAPPLQLVAHSAHLRGLQWIPVPYAQPGATPKDGTPPTTPSDRGRNGQKEPPVIPLVPSHGLDPTCILRVSSQGRRGVPLSKIDMRWMDDKPNEHGTVYRESLVHIDAVRAVVDSPDWCVCHLVPGPTVRIAGIGAEWPGTFVEQPGYPARKEVGSGSECFTFGKLCQLVVGHFLTWWTNEVHILYAHGHLFLRFCSFQQESRAEKMRTSGIRLERFPLVLGPGTMPLENLVLVAIRRRHIALGVYEWLPEIEVAP